MAKNIVVNNSFSSLMPNGVYGSKFKKNLLSVLPEFDELKSPSIFEDEINDDLINVWCVESKELEKLKKGIGVSSIQHESSVFLKKCLSKEKDGLFFFQDADHLNAVVVKNRTVQLQNKYDYNQKEDLLYFTLLLKDQFTMTGKVFLLGAYDRDILDFMSSYMTDIERLEFSPFKSLPLSNINISALELCE